MANYNYNANVNTWNQIANEQAYNAMNAGGLNETQMPSNIDPIFGQYHERITRDIFRIMRLSRHWDNIGTTSADNAYPGIIRESIMKSRKGRNFEGDNAAPKTELGAYEIVMDDVELRYHSTQFRMSYAYTLVDYQLRRFSGGNGSLISQTNEARMVNAANYRNMFIDSFRKQILAQLSIGGSKDFVIAGAGDPADRTSLTQDEAQEWLQRIDSLLWILNIGTAEYNLQNEFRQVPKANLQMIMPREWYWNLIRKAFPETRHREYFEGILPSNLILIDNWGNEQLEDGNATIVNPTFDSKGMNLLNWEPGYTTVAGDPDLRAMIIDKRAMCIEDNLTYPWVGLIDGDLLMTPCRNHYWTKGWFTDLLTSINIKVPPVTP